MERSIFFKTGTVIIISRFFLLTLFLIISCTWDQKDIKNGLVAAYTFSGNTLDESGGNNHAQGYGVQWTRDRFGQERSAVLLDGSSAYIEARVTNMPAVEQSQTISCWFMTSQPPSFIDSLGADNMIALVDSAAGIGVQFGFRAAGYHSSGFDTWYWGGRTVMEAGYPALGEWHHAAYTYDGTTHHFYLDGQQKTQSTATPQQGIPAILMIGNYPGGDQFFEGSIDDIFIYDRVLTLSEIEMLYNKKN